MNKKFLLAIIAFIFLCNFSAQAKQVKDTELKEVLLETNKVEELDKNYATVQAVSVSETEKTLRDKLRDVYHLEIDKYDKPNFLLKEVLTTHHNENSIIERTHLWGAYNGDIGLHFVQESMSSDHTTNHYDINTINVGYDIFFKDNSADMRLMFNYNPLSDRNVVQNLFADVYVATNKIPHHRFLIGNSRPPVGFEGGMGPYVLPFLARSQIARTFGTVRKLGARATGNYSLIDYDLGVYSSDTYFQEFFPGTEFVGWVNLKPLGKTDGRFGKLTIGGGLDAGNRDESFCVTGAYLGWEYKRFMANFEWADANGYNGPSGFMSTKHASGFYTTLGYMLTNKLQILARYDEFDPNKHISHNNKREISAGINYFIKGQGLKLIMNYVFCQNDNTEDSHRLMLGTQVLL